MTKPDANMMIDADGHPVPSRYVSRWDKLRDRKVRAIERRWQKLRERLDKEMEATLADIDELLVAREAETGTELADKGNFRVSDFRGNTAVEMSQSYRIYLDERVQEARRIMLEWATGLVREQEAETKRVLLALIDEAFRASTSGALPTGKILSLCKHDFQAPEWQRARQMLLEAIAPQRGKLYVSVMRRASRQHDWRRIKLDIADCWPEPTEEEVTNG